jgi:3-methyladenine DNA glycosylase/8-oxoguanine DNA glycosylase
MTGQTIELPIAQRVELYPKSPFNFDATLHKPSHFPSTDNCWEPGVRWQTMLWQSLMLGLKFEKRGDIDNPCIGLTVWSRLPMDPSFLDELLDEIRYRYSLELDLEPFYRETGSDPQLGPVILRWRGMRPMCACSLYEYLIIAIVLQNATVRRSVNMLQALYDAYGTRLAYDGRELSCFWLPTVIARATEEELRQLKVGYRAKAILRVTEAFAQGDLDEFDLRDQPREMQRGALLSLYGVGPASAGYILFDVFHHLDELNHISPWEQKIYSKLFYDTDPETPIAVNELLALFEQRFSGYKMLAVNYIWEGLFWKRKTEHIEWLEKLIRL